MKPEVAIFWFRRDLRLHDNAGLFAALKQNKTVVPLFIFDKTILDNLEDEDDARVTFIHREVERLNNELFLIGSALFSLYGNPIDIFKKLLESYTISAVYSNHDYEPYAKERDATIDSLLRNSKAKLLTFKDQVIFEKLEITKDDGRPYTVFTPYSKKWKATLQPSQLEAYPTELYFDNFIKSEKQQIPALKGMGFTASKLSFPPSEPSDKIIEKYHEQRDIPSINGTTRMSLHLRFGTVSIRELTRKGLMLNEKWLNELIWRDFYQMILWNFPHVVGNAFKPIYDRIEWRNNPEEFQKWCEGKTGYPIVDAGMRELNQTGFMHNRVRMVVASFLTKHLLIDWRWGEAYFARKLLDFELASNNGGWQWAAGSGCDAAPYFRVFNPVLQTEKFDPKAIYIKHWVPEFSDPFKYAKPMVDHKMARDRAIATYKKGLGATAETV